METSSDSENRNSASQIATETFVRRNRFQWIYPLLFNLGGQILVPRFHGLWQWQLFTTVNIALCLVRLPLEIKMSNPAAITNGNVRLLIILAVFQSFIMAFIASCSYLTFGFDFINLVMTVLLVTYTFGSQIMTRPNLRVLQSVAVVYTVLPALTALWLGGFAGYVIGALFLGVLVFCLQQGRLGNAEFWELLHVNRDLQLARRQAEASVHIKAELIAKHTRQSVIAGERARIAAEWHDTLLAGFSAIGWQLDLAQKDLRLDPPKTAEAIKVARTMLNHYRTESRLVIADMQNKSVSEPENLQEAVTRVLDAFCPRNAVKLQVTSVGTPLPLASDKSYQVVRFCQEAVSNALQHAAAQAIQVIIQNQPHQIRIEVLDDGSGFDPQIVVPGHYGLEIMKDRARRVNGQLEIHSELGGGTRLVLTMPTEAEPQKSHVTVLLIEDQFFSRLALRSVLESCEDFMIIGEAGTGALGIDVFRQHQPDVTIVDLCLPDISGFDVIKSIRHLDPNARIVVVSNLDGADDIRRATEAGAAAYLTKNASSQELLQAIAAVVSGKPYLPESVARRVAKNELTPRERDVLEQLVNGLTNRDIGLRLGIAEKTVRVHITAILAKLGVADRTQAAAVALQRGMVDLPSSRSALA